MSARFHLLLLRSETLFQMMSGVPHHCHHISLVWRHTCFVQLTKTELSPWSLYICAWLCLGVDLLMVFLKNALMCILRNVKLIQSCLYVYFMLLFIILYIIHAYLMMFTTSFNAVCLYNAYFSIWHLQMLFIICFILVYWHSLFISNNILHHAQCF